MKVSEFCKEYCKRADYKKVSEELLIEHIHGIHKSLKDKEVLFYENDLNKLQISHISFMKNKYFYLFSPSDNDLFKAISIDKYIGIIKYGYYKTESNQQIWVPDFKLFIEDNKIIALDLGESKMIISKNDLPVNLSFYQDIVSQSVYNLYCNYIDKAYFEEMDKNWIIDREVKRIFRVPAVYRYIQQEIKLYKNLLDDFQNVDIEFKKCINEFETFIHWYIKGHKEELIKIIKENCLVIPYLASVPKLDKSRTIDNETEYWNIFTVRMSIVNKDSQGYDSIFKFIKNNNKIFINLMYQYLFYANRDAGKMRKFLKLDNVVFTKSFELIGTFSVKGDTKSNI